MEIFGAVDMHTRCMRNHRRLFMQAMVSRQRPVERKPIRQCRLKFRHWQIAKDYLGFASEPVEMSSALLRLKMSLATSRCLPSSVWTEIRILPSRTFAS